MVVDWNETSAPGQIRKYPYSGRSRIVETDVFIVTASSIRVDRFWLVPRELPVEL